MKESTQAMFDVVSVALACMMVVIIAGELAKPYMPVVVQKQLVPCSIEIHDMARKLNIQLLSNCEVEN